uniref:non-specific serine/threonine protein kinase n=1 Tax=Saccoglossus kowalevskii TaxID=10224 RepID=A0ABM0N0R3_SACKO|nr:PREDICTED: myosin-IIIa-like [Saccoglossus kowalevskii]
MKLVDICNGLEDPTDKWELIDSIGEGTYGEVFTAKNKETEELTAAKIMDASADTEEEIEAEYGIFKNHCVHPNLPKFYGAYYKKTPSGQTDQIWLVMEFCHGGAVTDLIKGMLKRDERMDERLIAYIIKETLTAIKYLHDNRVIHRDIKGHNVLMTADAQIKLIDFGVSAQLRRTMMRRNTSVGTPFWMAPEVIACEQQIDYTYDNRCDIWSLGITAIELGDGDPPLSELHPMRALIKIPRCLVKDFEKRPTAQRLLNHPFIKKVPKDTNPLRLQLIEMMAVHQQLGGIQQAPEVTTKRGKLNRPAARKSRRTRFPIMDDLAQLEHLDEDVLVKHLYERYQFGQVYTYVGDIMIAVNPFTQLNIYDDRHSLRYNHADKGDNPPHIFGVADSTYQAMLHYTQDQCLVISGESGAGKTESANLLVTQLTKLGKALNRSLEEKVLQVNPLMEAFGNARTVINDNSSRFGKYLELKFTPMGHVIGAEISQYLLEKSRVIFQAKGERNFHIFYYVLAGLSSDDDNANVYHFKNKTVYRYLKGGGNLTYKDVANMSINKVKFKVINKCLETIGFTSEEIHQMYCLLSGILHIGEVTFESLEMKHMSDTSKIADSKRTKRVAELLLVEEQELKEALTTNSVVTRGETIVRSNTVQQAEDVRDAMSKAIYGRLFNWIVNRINVLLKPSQDSSDGARQIGILDIFGFENFRVNSFEQLCINIANEQIQYYFNQHIFAWEQQEYISEGIDADMITYEDNRPLLDMFLQKPMGMLSLLDEESRFPEATEQTLVDKFYKNLSKKYYWKPLQHGLSFGIYHYAGKVEYIASRFLEKNRDTLAPDIVLLLRSSEMPLVRTLFERQLTRTGNLADARGLDEMKLQPVGRVVKQKPMQQYQKGRSSFLLNGNEDIPGLTQNRNKMTVASYFRYSLMELLSKMVSGTPHFVRCIKPNDQKTPGQFDRDKVMIQLRYTGVLETTRIRRQGYSHRITFSDFVHRYKVLSFNMNEDVEETAEMCERIIKTCGMTNWLMGRTKVFLKYYHVDKLDKELEKYHKMAIRAQAVMRGWIAKIKYKRLIARRWKSAILLQKCVKGWMARIRYRRITARRWMAAYKIQQAFRRQLAMKRYAEELSRNNKAAITIQRIYRGYIARYKYKRLMSTITIQSYWRGHRVRKAKELNHRMQMRKIIIAQAAVRGFLCRQQYKVIKARHDSKKWDSSILLQRWFRMWKKRSLYQQIQLYRSQQETRLIFFLQQV